LPRLAPRRAPRARRTRRVRRSATRLRPDALGGRRAAVPGRATDPRLPPRGGGRRDRCQHAKSWSLLVRQPDHGRVRARARAPARGAVADYGWDIVLVTEVHTPPCSIWHDIISIT